MTKCKCKKCGKIFFTYNAWIRKGGGKFCSRSCAHKETWKFKDSPGYGTLHQWIAKNYGKAQKCEASTCNGKSNVYDWALKKGRDYDWNIKSYLQLCRSCHKKYDFVKTRLNVRERFMTKNPLQSISRR